ncbi:MAG: DivIVA domain-containing protein [Oscillospiraceae bacterium]|jgi:DivIVA domain-containing protein|nr:DivIVA domain-containing protein [Oscillospiraceae bacterium]
MLTSEQIRNHTFKSAGKGLLKSEDVDAFLEEAAAALESQQASNAELQQSNAELYQRVEALAGALNQLRSERELIPKTMILAQKTAEELSLQAQEESDRLRREAQTQAEHLGRTSREEASALVANATSEAEKILREAQGQAELALSRARAKADALLEEAGGKAEKERVRLAVLIEQEQGELLRMQRETDKFRTMLLGLYAQQIGVIESLPKADLPKEEPQPVPVRPKPIPPAVPETPPVVPPVDEPLPPIAPLTVVMPPNGARFRDSQYELDELEAVSRELEDESGFHLN